jgi:hypothetical protein
MSRFTDALAVSPLADGKTWVLIQPFGYEVGDLGMGDVVDVQIGFMTDFASIPRCLWLFLPRWGKYGNAAVIHDWLYWSQERSRTEADTIMFEAMGILGVPAWQRYPIYWAVHCFGFIAWVRNQWDREAGFERVLKDRKVKAIRFSGRPGLFRRTMKRYFGKSSK